MKLSKKNILFIFGIVAFAIGIFFSHQQEEPKLWSSICVAGLMVFFWLFEVLPIYATALLPLILGKPLGLIDEDSLAASYGDKLIYLFLGGFVLAVAMEKWSIHKQIAAGIIQLIGNSKSRILLGFMISTAVLSMFISNTATTVMMLPMALAVTQSEKKDSKFALFLLLGIAYSASVGGMATLVGSPPNGSMVGILERNYGIQIDFLDWMKVGLPISLTMLTGIFLYFFIRMRSEGVKEKLNLDIQRKKWTNEQKKVMVVFLVTIVLWLLRKSIASWTGLPIGDESIAMLGAISLFLIDGKDEKILIWKDMKNLAWGILLLFGGGFAMAKMLEVNGAITQIASIFNGLAGVSIWIIVGVLVFIAIFGTEVMSNTALVNVFIPVIATFAVSQGLPLVEMCLPVALSASCAFMLPISTPPNAIIFSSGKITIPQMVRNGFLLNLLAWLVIWLFFVL